MKIYTRTGDAGETGLFGGSRAAKDDLRLQAIGAVDEVNAALGLARSLGLDDEMGERVAQLQGCLFELGADLSDPNRRQTRITPERVAELEAMIDRYEAELDPLRNFILPGGTPPASALHVARTVCRHAERTLVSLAREADINEEVLSFVNRLSDLLFVMARVANRRAGVSDVDWLPRKTHD